MDPYYIVKVSCGHHSGALTDAGEIFLWGTGVFGEFVSPFRASKHGLRFKDIEIGSFFGSAVDETGLIWSWGSNTSGELGLGDYEPRKSVTPSNSLQGRVISRLSCGGSYVIALGIIIKTHRRRNLNISPSDSLQDSKQVFFSKTPQGTQSFNNERSQHFSHGRDQRGEYSTLPESTPKEHRNSSLEQPLPQRDSRDVDVQRRSPFRFSEARPSDHSYEVVII